MSDEAILLHSRDARGVHTLTLNTPKAFNALSEAMLAALEREFGHTGHGGGDASLQWNRPVGGMFLWARHPDIQNATELAYQAAEQDILLGPGHLFDPELQPSPWFRFNVAFTDDPRVLSFLSDHRHAG